MGYDLKSIEDSNLEMLTYFNRLYSEHNSSLQQLRAKIFETNVKIDELSRTKSVYSLNSDYRKNVFSPIPRDPESSDKEQKIKNEIQALNDERDAYQEQINTELAILKGINKKLEKIEKAKNAIRALSLDQSDTDSQEIDDDFEFIEDDKQDETEIQQHLKNILMIDTFDNSFLATLLDKRVFAEIGANSHKLEIIKNLIQTDPSRAKITIDEVISNSKSIQLLIKTQLNRMNYYFDDKKSMENMIEDFVSEKRDQHPELVIDYEVGELNLKPDFSRFLILYRLINIFFDNVFAHSRATRVYFKVVEIDRTVDVIISDNGIGIPNNYMERSEWYSGIHRAKELLFMIGGKLVIDGEKNGTEVRFTFNI